MESYTRSRMRLNSFTTLTQRRSEVEMLHDILVSARIGLKKTVISASVSLGYDHMKHLLEVAKRAGLIEELEATEEQKWWKGKPTIIWRTTDKGLEWARRVWEDYALVRGAEE